jgi:hypothetical protein
MGLRMYPVPADERLILEFRGTPGDKMIISVTDIIGREILSLEKEVQADNRIELDTRAWLPGAGIVKIKIREKILYGRFIIE